MLILAKTRNIKPQVQATRLRVCIHGCEACYSAHVAHFSRVSPWPINTTQPRSPILPASVDLITGSFYPSVKGYLEDISLSLPQSICHSGHSVRQKLPTKSLEGPDGPDGRVDITMRAEVYYRPTRVSADLN